MKCLDSREDNLYFTGSSEQEMKEINAAANDACIKAEQEYQIFKTWLSVFVYSYVVTSNEQASALEQPKRHWLQF